MPDPVEEFLAAMAAAEKTGGPLPVGPGGGPLRHDFSTPMQLGGSGLTVLPENWRAGGAPISGPVTGDPALAPIPPRPQLSFVGGPLSPGRLSGGASISGSGPLGDLRRIDKEIQGLEIDPADEEQFISAVGRRQTAKGINLETAGNAVGRQVAQEEKTALSLQTLESMQQAMHTEARQQIDDARIVARYAGLSKSPGEIREMQSIAQNGRGLDGKEATPEERKKAAKQLAQAENIDPRRALRGFRGIAAALAAALGELGGAMTGRPNRVVDMLQHAIDNDIAAQKEAFESKRAAVRDTFNAYEFFSRQGVSEREAILATNAFLRENVALVAKQMGIRNEQLDLDTWTDQARMDLGREKLKLNLDKLKTRADIAQTRGSLALGNRQAAIAEGKAGQPSKREVTLPLAIQELRELIALRREHGSETLPNETKATMESKASSLLFDIASLAEQGALQKADREVAEGALGNATGYGFQLARMEALLKRWERLAGSSGVETGVTGLEEQP